MPGKITIKDVPKERVVSLGGKEFSESRAMEFIKKIMIWLSERGIGVTDLPLVIVEENRSFEACVPIKEDLKEEGEFKIKTLPAHRVGEILHENPETPLSLSEGFLERQLRYQGFTLGRPYRYLFRANPSFPKKPFIIIQIPIHK